MRLRLGKGKGWVRVGFMVTQLIRVKVMVRVRVRKV